MVSQKRWHTREDSGIRLDAEGRFWHDDVLVENPNVARAFHRGLDRAPDGRYLIRFGWDWAYITVEDTPYQVLGLATSDEAIVLRLDDETTEPLDPHTLCAREGVLFARVKAGAHLARFSRAAQAQLAPFLEEIDGQLAFARGGEVIRVPPRAD